jgi:hypothetical protein
MSGPAGRDPLEAPVFLVGAERSGTTLLRIMLDGHPDVAFAPESEFLVDWIGPDGRFPPLPAYREALAQDRVFQLSGLRIDPSLSFPALARSFLAQRAAGARVVGATVHRHFDRLLPLFPGARFIHLLRDGRDVAASVIGRGWAGNAWAAAARWEEAESLWEGLAPRLAPERVLEVRYERLVADPEAALRRLAAFLGVAFDPAMLDVASRSRYRPPDASRAEAWRRALSPRAVRLVEARVGPWLERRGYPPSGLAPLRVGPLGALALRVHDRLGRLRRNAAILGWRLRLAEGLTRRLGMRRLHARLLRRVHAVRNARLD